MSKVDFNRFEEDENAIFQNEFRIKPFKNRRGKTFRFTKKRMKK